MRATAASDAARRQPETDYCLFERQPYLPRFMAGGEGNPLGARALYLGSTLYRIHGTNQPSTIGSFVPSGCIRLTNADIADLYAPVKVGTRVVVLRGRPPATSAAAAVGSAVSSGAPTASDVPRRKLRTPDEIASKLRSTPRVSATGEAPPTSRGGGCSDPVIRLPAGRIRVRREGPVPVFRRSDDRRGGQSLRNPSSWQAGSHPHAVAVASESLAERSAHGRYAQLVLGMSSNQPMRFAAYNPRALTATVN